MSRHEPVEGPDFELPPGFRWEYRVQTRFRDSSTSGFGPWHESGPDRRVDSDDEARERYEDARDVHQSLQIMQDRIVRRAVSDTVVVVTTELHEPLGIPNPSWGRR